MCWDSEMMGSVEQWHTNWKWRLFPVVAKVTRPICQPLASPLGNKQFFLLFEGQ